MLTSPFQQPSPRQNLLAGQIHEATGRGDEHQLLLLQTQWVHRFGVETLPVDASQAVVSHPREEMAGHSAEADVMEDQRIEETFFAAVEENIEEAVLCDQEQLHADAAQLTQDVEPHNDSEQIDQQEESEAASSPFERFTSLLSETVDERSEIEEKQDAQDSDAQDSDAQDSGSDPVEQPAPLAAAPVSAPPIRTPRSLRRWLPGGVDGFAEAS